MHALFSSQAIIFKHMRLIGMAFYESDLDQLESMWSPDIFGEMMATNNAIMQEDWVLDKSPALVILSGMQLWTLKCSTDRAS